MLSTPLHAEEVEVAEETLEETAETITEDVKIKTNLIPMTQDHAGRLQDMLMGLLLHPVLTITRMAGEPFIVPTH